ncbi:uncharacterized protein LOC133467297 [Phyllopteryx taeniolatus]|uniref:uncharacterized protein LOC133467297 n=1 Tax=Phyllopteryx taeniolatus TaxID=161469 RepID=UPI002AD1F099|nr:uncharacterized protein LOC133467297 [Phyllopteryx taeniolatus]
MSSISHLMQDTEQLWKITQGGKHELEFLKTKVRKQQHDIERLKDEKHDQDLLVRTLRLQMKHYTQKLEMSKKTAMKEQMLLQKILTFINKETQILGGQHNEIKTKHNLELINFLKSKSEEHKEGLTEHKHQIKQQVTGGCIQSLMTKNWKTIIGAKYAKEYMQKSMTHLNQELNRNGKEVLQFKHEIKCITNVMTVIVKHIEKIWPQMQRHTKIQKAASTGIKLKEIVEKYSVLENNGQQLGDIIKHTVNTRKHMEEDKITLYPKNKVNAKIHKIFLEEKRLRKHLARRLNAKEFTKRKIKCMRYQVKKKHQELDQRLQRTMKERDELEILKLKLQKQRDELEEKQNDLMQTMETMAKHCCRGAQHVQVHVNEMTRMKSVKRVSLSVCLSVCLSIYQSFHYHFIYCIYLLFIQSFQ